MPLTPAVRRPCRSGPAPCPRRRPGAATRDRTTRPDRPQAEAGPAAAARRGPSLKEKADFDSRRRHLVVKREEKLSDAKRADLAVMVAMLPALAVPRRFTDAVYGIFDGAASADPEFLAVPVLAEAIRRLVGAPEFAKVAGHLNRPDGLRERTNNHVERINRSLRLLDKVCHGWRRRRTLVLKFDDIWVRLSSLQPSGI